jgi:hypothetical protein
LPHCVIMSIAAEDEDEGYRSASPGSHADNKSQVCTLL